MTTSGTWNFAPSGYPTGAATYTGPALFPNGIDPGSTETLVIVFGPGGATFLNMPSPVQGASGVPPELRDVTINVVPYGESLPSPAGTWSEVTPGGPGTAAVYDATYSLNGGEPGNAATYTIAAATDLVGSLFSGATLLWNSVSNHFVPTALPVGSWYNATSIASTTTSAGEDRLLSSITIPSQPFAYWPIVFATSTITGTANTRVDLVARLNNQSSGFELGRGPGQSGAVTGTNPFATYMLPTFGGGALSTGTNGQVAASTAATIYLVAEQQASTTDVYATSNTMFAVAVAPVPPA